MFNRPRLRGHGEETLGDALHEIDDLARDAAGAHHEFAVALLGELGAEAEKAAVLILPFAGARHQRADGLLAGVLRHVVEGAVPHGFDGHGQFLDR